MKKLIHIVGILIGTCLIAYNQDCSGFHQYHCDYSDYTFFYSRQSNSALFAKGETSEMKFITYAGEEYYINVCAHRKFGDIHFKIYEDNSAKNLIYDNATDNYSSTVVFENEVTRNMIIEITVPEEKGNFEKRCVGVLIQFKKKDI